MIAEEENTAHCGENYLGNRSRITDSQKIGKSKIVPYKDCETAGERHQRRFETNNRNKIIVQTWCKENRFVLDVKNGGHHWIIKKKNILIEWWPSSAKLVINKEWYNSIYCHDYLQLIDLLSKKFKSF